MQKRWKNANVQKRCKKNSQEVQFPEAGHISQHYDSSEKIAQNMPWIHSAAYFRVIHILFPQKNTQNSKISQNKELFNNKDCKNMQLAINLSSLCDFVYFRVICICTRLFSFGGGKFVRHDVVHVLFVWCKLLRFSHPGCTLEKVLLKLLSMEL